MQVEISTQLLAGDLTERLHRVGLSFIGKDGGYRLVDMKDHPELFPEVIRQQTKETQNLSPA